ncbi:uncharacterized protein EV154DRAFT_488136 [Mucor mucedo]|uniref:uncharacterized protein n=1 Tax=Mucor mucedo TaxID=29922 RepID=UPI00221EFC63|nr:uncharacterized protein EV154DRAFT_488136 [Mucor mucedo]KAI7868396.1 hypothetical protein EV154DRAFT_488136 [Mucor mucedo]
MVTSTRSVAGIEQRIVCPIGRMLQEHSDKGLLKIWKYNVSKMTVIPSVTYLQNKQLKSQIIHKLPYNFTYLKTQQFHQLLTIRVFSKFIAHFVSLLIHFYILIKAALPSTDIPLSLDIVNQRFVRDF